MSVHAKRLAKRLAEINGAVEQGVALPPPETAFNKYKAAIKQLLVDFLGSDIELLYFEWDATDQAFTIQLEHWNSLPGSLSLPMAARHNTSWAPPHRLESGGIVDKNHAGPVDAHMFSTLFEEINRWRAKIETMFRAARQVEHAPDLGPLPEKR